MLISLGVDFRRAELPVREHFQLASVQLPLIYRALRRWRGRGIVLGTCNRMEIIAAVAPGEVRRARAELIALVRRLAPSPAVAEKFLSLAEVRHESEAALHLLRVAAGLESRIVGDTQILGQVRAAYQLAAAHGAPGAELHRLCQIALKVGRRVRGETGLVRRHRSAGSSAAGMIAQRLGSLAGRDLVILGSGKVAATAARRLVALGADRLTVLGRTAEHAWSLALEAGGHAGSWALRHERLAWADAAIVATAAHEPILGAADLESARRAAASREHPLLLIDVGLPRNVDPAVARLPHVRVVDLDALGAGPDQQAVSPGDIQRAERIVEDELAGLLAWRLRRTGQPASQEELRPS